MKRFSGQDSSDVQSPLLFLWPLGSLNTENQNEREAEVSTGFRVEKQQKPNKGKKGKEGWIDGWMGKWTDR